MGGKEQQAGAGGLEAAAFVAELEGNAELAARLRALEYRDLRRTCVVRLGEIGLEDGAISARIGHSLKTVQQILEIYMPRTEAMAARGTIAMLEVERERRHSSEPQEKSA